MHNYTYKRSVSLSFTKGMRYQRTWRVETMDMGGAPPHTDTLIRSAACGQGQIGLFTTMRQSQNALSLETLFLCSWTLLQLRPSTRARLAWKPVRWTLALKTNHLKTSKTVPVRWTLALKTNHLKTSKTVPKP